ncbi:ParB/RepB/Spo0J family partition protein [uncultured Demequina sp.]|uniref:ParB/RepB/Spo0J family partition protein n=1 Tax=uncultured Demequina sp. TaxID=693499 RepID=UPI00260100FC|nr:ParB/RepB/Spo0J family partition protein [uncultured Demequina sp.]
MGRGLDALLPKSSDRVPQMVAVDQLTPSPYQPRSRLDDAKVAELAASVAEKGVLQPLLVRPREGGFEIVAGERRFRAAQKAGLSSVPVVVRELTDQETLEVAIVENLQREDLTALEEAHAYERLMTFGLDQAAVARSVGKSRSAVANTLRLLQLPQDAMDALAAGAISAGHARAILAQPEPDRAWALEQIVGRGLSVRQAEALKRPIGGTRRNPSDGRYRGLEEDLARHAGTMVRVRGGKKGRIELHFRSEEELERLLELLGYQA